MFWKPKFQVCPFIASLRLAGWIQLLLKVWWSRQSNTCSVRKIWAAKHLLFCCLQDGRSHLHCLSTALHGSEVLIFFPLFPLFFMFLFMLFLLHFHQQSHQSLGSRAFQLQRVAWRGIMTGPGCGDRVAKWQWSQWLNGYNMAVAIWASCRSKTING